MRTSTTLAVHRGDDYVTSQLYPGGGRLSGEDGEIAWQMDPDSRIGLQVARWRAPFATRTRAQLWWRRSFR